MSKMVSASHHQITESSLYQMEACRLLERASFSWAICFMCSWPQFQSQTSSVQNELDSKCQAKSLTESCYAKWSNDLISIRQFHMLLDQNGQKMAPFCFKTLLQVSLISVFFTHAERDNMVAFTVY